MVDYIDILTAAYKVDIWHIHHSFFAIGALC